ncbi:MAG: hypothetical protein U0R52_01615 [Solirubrobacterales bacterium]
MKWAQIAVVAGFALAGGLLAGCGGGGDSGTDTQATVTGETTALTKEEVIQQGDGICAEVNAAIGTLEGSTADSTAMLSQEADLYSGMMDRLEGLDGPANDSDLQAVYSAGDNLVQATKDAQLAAERGDSTALASNQQDVSSALADFQGAATAYGFKECGQGPQAPPTTGVPATGTTTPATSPDTPVTSPSTTPVAPVTTTPAAPVTPAAPTTTGGAGGTGGGTTGGGTAGGSTGGSSGGVGPG